MSILERDINRSMVDYLPRYYEDITEVNAIISAEAEALNKLNFDANEVLAQFYVDRASWGLVHWEKLIGVENPESYTYSTFKSLEAEGSVYNDIVTITWDEFELKYPKSLDERRSDIKSKIRGQGTVTKGHIKNVAESYANGEVDVIEYNANYTITIEFVSEYGVPSSIDVIKSALREIIPAHLSINYAFKYVTYSQLGTDYANYDAVVATGYTYDELVTNGG